MVQSEIKKQISIFVPVSDWRALRQEAARQRIPITELCRRWISPELQRLPHGENAGARGTGIVVES
jgi:hypothetical protein